MTKHDEEQTMLLMTGEYTSCNSCQNEVIEKNMQPIRDDFTTNTGFMPRYIDAHGIAHGPDGQTAPMPYDHEQEMSA